MSINSLRTIPKIIRHSVIQAISFAILIAALLAFVYTFVYYYQQKRLHVQQLGELLASSASNPDGANLVARQVSLLLDNDPSLQSIVFYSTDNPVNSLYQNEISSISNDWYNALLTHTISFNYPVTSRYFDGDSIQRASSSQPLLNNSSLASSANNKETQPPLSQPAARNTLVGHINITLDIASLRWHWIRVNSLPWLITMVLGILFVRFIARKLNWPTQDIIALAKVCEVAVDNPQLEQLPTIQQRFEFQEIIRIKRAFIILFERLKAAQHDYQVLADFEQQLHNKDLSLDIQRSNFQNMITHELKTSLNAITGGLQLLDDPYLNEEQRDTLAIIYKGSQHLERTLEQIIQLNRIEKGQTIISLSEFNPLQMIADLLEEFEPAAKQKQLEFISRVHHVEYMLEGDANKIQQILNTLIDNAIKFTHSGQVIIDSQLTHFNESVRWQVKIIDTGIGIDACYIEDIFVPFFQIDSSETRMHEGVGIGLSVIKQMAQLLGATIEVNSELGVGSQFIVTMPLRYKNHMPQQNLLQGIDIVYYHYDEAGSIVEGLQRLGASVDSLNNEQSLLHYMENEKVVMVMFADEVLPEQVIYLAKRIRDQERTSRALLIYWYPAHKAKDIDRFEYELKTAGIDYYHSMVNEVKVLASLLDKWLI